MTARELLFEVKGRVKILGINCGQSARKSQRLWVHNVWRQNIPQTNQPEGLSMYETSTGFHKIQRCNMKRERTWNLHAIQTLGSTGLHNIGTLHIPQHVLTVQEQEASLKELFWVSARGSQVLRHVPAVGNLQQIPIICLENQFGSKRELVK